MCINKNHPEQAWISLILRLAMATLFAVASISKFVGGISTTVHGFQEMFKATWLPLFLVTPYAYAIAFIEALIVILLVTGIKLREAWILTALTLVSLAFGMMVAGQGQTAAGIYTYLVITCFGLYVSRHDECVLGKK